MVGRCDTPLLLVLWCLWKAATSFMADPERGSESLLPWTIRWALAGEPLLLSAQKKVLRDHKALVWAISEGPPSLRSSLLFAPNSELS